MLLILLFSWYLSLVADLVSGSGVVEDQRRWQSEILDRPIAYRLTQEAAADESITILRLTGLPDFRPAVGGEHPLEASGYRIIDLDYRGDERAVFPFLSQDIAKLRNDIFRHGLFKEYGLDVARIFVLPDGYNLQPDVLYFDDAERPLYLDVAYPANASESVPCLLEFSCDNTDRMGNFSLAVCRDTLLEGFATNGYAYAMADHPMPPPYKGIDNMPECIDKAKSAVRALRFIGREIGIAENIGVVGFSRGSGVALSLATARVNDIEESGALYPNTDDSVQAAVVLSGRFTYLDLLEDDNMMPRYEKAWGSFVDYSHGWRRHGALDYLEDATIPLFLSINSGEGPDAQHQMKVLRDRLSGEGSPYEYLEDGDNAGHKVPISPGILDQIENYLSSRLR